MSGTENPLRPFVQHLITRTHRRATAAAARAKANESLDSSSLPLPSSHVVEGREKGRFSAGRDDFSAQEPAPRPPPHDHHHHDDDDDDGSRVSSLEIQFCTPSFLFPLSFSLLPSLLLSPPAAAVGCTTSVEEGKKGCRLGSLMLRDLVCSLLPLRRSSRSRLLLRRQSSEGEQVALVSRERDKETGQSEARRCALTWTGVASGA